MTQELFIVYRKPYGWTALFDIGTWWESKVVVMVFVLFMSRTQHLDFWAMCWYNSKHRLPKLTTIYAGLIICKSFCHTVLISSDLEQYILDSEMSSNIVPYATVRYLFRKKIKAKSHIYVLELLYPGIKFRHRNFLQLLTMWHQGWEK